MIASRVSKKTSNNPSQTASRILRPAWVVAVSLAVVGVYGAVADDASNSPAQMDLRLVDIQQMVMRQNDEIQMRLYDAEASERMYRAERGIFEPNFVGGVNYSDLTRPNDRQQTAQLGFFARNIYLEQNTTYNSAIEFLLGTGAKIRTGYLLREMNNNIGAPEDNPRKWVGKQYESFAGINLTQPLLKNGWSATSAKIRMAAISSKIAFQEYRRQILLVMAGAEAAYWDLRLSQDQTRIGAASLEVAEKILRDNKARAEVGKSSELEVIQAQAGVADRKARFDQARQTSFDYASKLSTLYSRTTTPGAPLPRAVDQPVLVDEPLQAIESYEAAFKQNPDYLIRREQVEQEHLRVSYMKNQRLPQLDLQSSFGLNGLGNSPGASWNDWTHRDYPTWSVGAEFRVPLGGGIKEKNELAAAKLGKMRALTGLKEAEVQLFNLIDASTRKIQLYRNNVTNALAVVDFTEKLLKTQMDRLAVGTTDSKTVLETEDKLREARISVVENMVMERKAHLELETARGSLLASRDSEIDLIHTRNQMDAVLTRRKQQIPTTTNGVPATAQPAQ